MAVEKDELDNLFTDSDKDELERLKVLLRDNRYGYYLATSVPVEVDWEMCKGYARETGVSDEYLTEANFNRAVEYALQKIALGYTSVGDCNKIRSSLEKLLSEHSDNEKMAQEIEEVLALVKQPKVITAEEQLVSAWNKYISLRMEGKE